MRVSSKAVIKEARKQNKIKQKKQESTFVIFLSMINDVFTYQYTMKYINMKTNQRMPTYTALKWSHSYPWRGMGTVQRTRYYEYSAMCARRPGSSRFSMVLSFTIHNDITKWFGTT